MSIYRECISILTPDAACSANYIYDNCAWLRFQIEKMLKQIEMGLDSHICFTKMNNNQDVEDRIWGQVVCLNPPMIKKASEKVRGWNSETAQDMGLKFYGFLRSFARRSIS